MAFKPAKIGDEIFWEETRKINGKKIPIPNRGIVTEILDSDHAYLVEIRSEVVVHPAKITKISRVK